MWAKKKGVRGQHQRQAGRTNGPVVELFSLELSLEIKMAPAPGYLRGLWLALPTQVSSKLPSLALSALPPFHPNAATVSRSLFPGRKRGGRRRSARRRAGVPYRKPGNN